MCCCWRLLRQSAIELWTQTLICFPNLGQRKWAKPWSKTWYNIKEGYQGRLSRKAIFIPQIKPHNRESDYKISTIIPLYQRKREQGHQCSLLTQRVLAREGTLKEHSVWQFLLFIQSFDLGIVCIHCSSGSLTDVSHFLVIVVANEILKGIDLFTPLNCKHWVSVSSGHQVCHVDLHACSAHCRLDSHLWERHCFLDSQSTNLLDSHVGFPWLQDNVVLITKALWINE
jgi:hypothetical protein